MGNEVENIIDPSLTKKFKRADILAFETELLKMDGAFVGDTANCPLRHTFSDGIYVREIFLPKGVTVVGKIHKHDHPNFLRVGQVIVATENGLETITAPCSMISPAGTKRVVHALQDCIWVTVHTNPTNTKDLVKIEDHVIAKSYDEYDKFKKGYNRAGKNRLLSFIYKLLKKK